MQSTNFFNLAYVFQKIYDLLTGQYFPSGDSFLALMAAILSFIKPLSILLSLFFLTGIIYAIIRTRAIMLEVTEKVRGYSGVESHAVGRVSGAAEALKPSSARWQKITQHIDSANPSDWRLSILECDIILDEMLTKMSYHGETVSDKLKAVEKSDFLTIDKAWEAHRVRNAIAHEGSNFQITDREARRVVGLYEEVFKEFHYM
ncbi:MAG: hypothetical protein HYV67_01395 [Candidatus Taylorbacteria bacterium]|nr:hypothetical protein [Candidatus Taylorbacteria bacterium]